VGGAVAVPLDIEFSGPSVDKQPAFVQVNNPPDKESRLARGEGRVLRWVH
jgi:hypothetical protein